MKLNKNLINKQKLNKKDITKIKKLHKKKNKLFKMIKYHLKKDNIEKVLDLTARLIDIEYAMQDAWKFERNSDMHTHWLYNPACSCPKMDNYDLFYTGQRIYVENCIVHGKLIKGEN